MLALLFAPLLALAAVAQGGYTTETFPEHGLTFPRARHFIQVPVTPDDAWRVLYFVERQAGMERVERSKATVFYVVRIDGAAGQGGQATSKNAPITDIARYLETFHRNTERSKGRDRRECDGYSGVEYDLIPKGEAKRAGWCFVYERLEPTPRTFAFIGYCERGEYARLAPIWREMAGKVRFVDPVAPDPGVWTRIYEKKPFRDSERRIEQRRCLVPGWEAEDTENFIALVHAPRKPFLKRILGELEALQPHFGGTLGISVSEGPIGVVRLCETRDEYLVYGGDPEFAVLWNDRLGELLLYDPGKDGDRAAEAETLGFLRGEAFEQYLQQRLGDLAQPWFSGGYAEYFTWAEIAGKSLRANAGRNLAYVKRSIEERRTVRWSELLRMERAEFERRRAFAQCGSLVYFLRHSKEAERNQLWSSLLPRYVSVLVAARAARIEAGDSPEAAREGARQAALDAALEGVDLEELEASWAAFTLQRKD